VLTPQARVPLLVQSCDCGGMTQVAHSEESSPEPERRPEERPPGHFVSAELQSDCSRFLEEIKEVVRHRIEAGLGREH
jgi:hypothetical protein